MNDAVRAVGVAGGVALGGLGAGVALVVAVLVAVRTAGVDPSPVALLVLSLVLVQGVTFGGVGLAYLRVRGRSLGSLVSLPTGRDLAVAVGGYVLALGAAVGGAVAVSLAGLEAGRNVAAEAAVRNPDLLLLLVPASFLLVGPGEELLFRGVVQGRLREALSAPAAVGLAAALFAAVHFVALSGAPAARVVTVVVLFGPALVFGTAYEMTDNLAVPALVHGAYNATLFTLLYASLRFGGGSAV